MSRLTARQLECLRLLAAGYRPPEIARRLYIADRTLKTDLKHLREALGARTTPHAVAIGYQRGLLTRDAPTVWLKTDTATETRGVPLP